MLADLIVGFFLFVGRFGDGSLLLFGSFVRNRFIRLDRRNRILLGRLRARLPDRGQVFLVLDSYRIDIDTAVIALVANVVYNDAVRVRLHNVVRNRRYREKLHDHQDRDNDRPEASAEQIVGQLCHVFCSSVSSFVGIEIL